MSAAWRVCRDEFARNRPLAVLAMGGFTAFPVVMAGRAAGAAAFLHDSNTIPGRASRLLAHAVDECFVGFPEAAERLWNPRVTWTGTPAREGFVVPTKVQIAAHRVRLGLDPQRPVLLVTGGSQGAHGLNRLFLAALPGLHAGLPELQYIHLTGEGDYAAARDLYDQLGCRALVQPFLSGMTDALAAASAVVSRAGASSIAELAALRLPSLLVPLPTAQDNHQYYNARALVASGAALMVEQDRISPAGFGAAIRELVGDLAMRHGLVEKIRAWHVADAADRIAGRILQAIEAKWPPVPKASQSKVVARAEVARLNQNEEMPA
jgi:UDP-N-acetylglucosamine--N-acetylmuramyl-(pentapeptide) pyrophosphoryl-undecaprenol N-acetylglucosamine transferase